jgi:CHAD domain-containing protein
MQPSEELLSSFERRWKEFSRTWEKARSKASEKFIHDLRVSARRLIARLELTRAVSGGDEIARVQKQFKKVLKRMGPLRDVQVQLENLAGFPVNGVVTDFRRTLQRRANDEIKGIRRHLRRGEKRRLEKGVRKLRAELEDQCRTLAGVDIRRSIERLVRLRRSDFFRARRQFRPGNDVTLHEMHIALKKLRYLVEAAEPVLGAWAKASARKMHPYQQLMENTRDIEILRAHLQKWAAKRGRTTAVVPVLDRLAEKRARMIKSITKSSDGLEHFMPIEHRKPAKETTRAAPELARLRRKRRRLTATLKKGSADFEQLVPPPKEKRLKEITHADPLPPPAVRPVWVRKIQ